MAEQTVPELAESYGLAHVLDSLRNTAQAAGIVRAVCLAVDAQEDGAVKYKDNWLCRWSPSIDAAILCLKKVQRAHTETTDEPLSVEWCMPLNLLEAMAAALWRMEDATKRTAMDGDDFIAWGEAVLESLSALHDDLSAVAKGMQGGAA